MNDTAEKKITPQGGFGMDEMIVVNDALRAAPGFSLFTDDACITMARLVIESLNKREHPYPLPPQAGWAITTDLKDQLALSMLTREARDAIAWVSVEALHKAQGGTAFDPKPPPEPVPGATPKSAGCPAPARPSKGRP